MPEILILTEQNIEIISVLAVAFCVALACTPLAIFFAKKVGVIDIPGDERRVHKKPIPRLGGLAIYIGTVASILIFIDVDRQMTGLLLSATVMFFLGMLDDIINVSAKIKLLGQIVCACILYLYGVRITTFMGIPFAEYHSSIIQVVSFLFTIFWIVGITNTINLIDGLDGLAAGIAAIASASIAYTAFVNEQPAVGLMTISLAGAALGFLPYNFNPAKIFMGDGGSLFLGFMLAGLSVMGLTKSATALVAAIPFFILGIPIFDTAFAILRRFINKKPIMEADRGHLHHRIMQKGLGQRRTVILLYSMSGLLGVAGVLLAKELKFEAIILIIITTALIYVFIKDFTSSETDDTKIFKR